MVVFILNDKLVQTDLPRGSTLLDFIRYKQGLTGTKIGCREGDCGACTVLEGKLESVGEPGEVSNANTERIRYRSIVSCLTPLGNVHGKHIVTVEGLNMSVLSPVQQAFVAHNGTQCGFCTPGFVVSLTSHAMSDEPSDVESAVASMDGNICRCTGYKSIEQAAISLSRLMKDKDLANPVAWLTAKGFLPSYFAEIPSKLIALREELLSGSASAGAREGGQAIRQSGEDAVPDQIMGGGTDLMVQQPDNMAERDPLLVFDNQTMKGIRRENSRVVIGAATTATDIMSSAIMRSLIPGIKAYYKLISSDPIRNMGTLGGNLVNASPIGDLSIFFLPLDPVLVLEECATKKRRTVALRDFFLDYKRLDLLKGEMVVELWFECPDETFQFNFEKVSKRTYLDIASVNSAIYCITDGSLIRTCRISYGGVAPVPLFLSETSAFLSGKVITADTVKQANEVLQQEITPISDVRGSVDYKRLLARQLLFAHFLKFFPDIIEGIQQMSR